MIPSAPIGTMRITECNRTPEVSPDLLTSCPETAPLSSGRRYTMRLGSMRTPAGIALVVGAMLIVRLGAQAPTAPPAGGRGRGAPSQGVPPPSRGGGGGGGGGRAARNPPAELPG